MVKIQFDLTKKENKRLMDLKHHFKVNGKADVIKNLIKEFREESQ